MLENDKRKYVPAIRFAAYNDYWQKSELHEFAEKITKKNKDNAVTETFTNSAVKGIVSQRDFFSKDISNKDNKDKYFVVEPNDFVYNPRISKNAPVGPIRRNNLGRTGIMSPLYFVFRNKGLNNTFLEYFFLGNLWHRHMLKYGNTGARADRFAITISDLEKMSVNHPIYEEQKKIGQIFTKLDELILLQEKHIKNSKQYKQAMLQKMFPKNNKVNPELRFIGFEDDWIETKLGDFVDTYRGLTYKPSNVSDNGVRVLRSSNIDVDTFRTFDDDVFVTEEVVNITLVENGDILVTSANGSINLVGKHAIIENVDNKMVHGGFMLLLKTDNPYFVNSWMSSSQYNRVLGMIQGGNGSIGNLSSKAFNNAKMTVPKSEEEQRVIGNFFKTLDRQIEMLNQRLKEYKNLKESLLNKMYV